MSKIICDICGTAYQDTATQCPICGTAKSDAAKNAGTETNPEQGGDYGYVKGGRFSHSNVKKRNANQELPRTAAPAKQPKEHKEPAEDKKTPRRKQEKEESGSNVGLIVIVVILVLAIIAACAYIAIRFIDQNDPDNTKPVGTQSTASKPTQETPPRQIPCTGLTLLIQERTFENVGDSMLLNVKLQPENTTDPVTYSSSDPYVATVDSNGNVVAVANGTTTITIRCGEFSAECVITCNVGVEPAYPTEPTQPPTEPTGPAYPDYVLEIYDPYGKRDITLNGYGSKHDFYKRNENGPSREEIIWISDNENIATITNGVVTAVGNGTTKVHAIYGDQKITVTVRCNNAEKPADAAYEVRTIYGVAYDISIKVGESLTLQLVDKETGLRVPAADLVFSLQKEGFVTVDENGRVTGVEVNYGGVYVYIEYEGVTYKCLVRVTPKPEN